ncbi:MAG: zinc-binding dehydrogenase [Pseudonocardiaceae bacterium]
MTTCRAAVSRHPNRSPTIEEIVLRQPRPGEILVRTARAGICGTDLHFAAGMFPYPFPAVLGHEASGVVETVGDGVRDVRPGDRVIVCDQTFCGRCAACIAGAMVYCTDTGPKQRQRDRIQLNGKPIRQYLGISAFAEMMLVDEHAVIPVPRELSFDAAALLACCLTTGMATVLNIARPAAGSSIAIFGCGGVGLGAVQAARISGAARIIAIDLEDHRLATAAQLGATDTINAACDDPIEAVLARAHSGVHRAIEAVGLPETAAAAFAVLTPGGHATVLGMLPPDTDVVLPGRLLRQGRTIGGTVMGNVRTRLDIPRYVDLVVTGQLRADELATSHHPLDEIETALREARTRRGVRAMITF